MAKMWVLYLVSFCVSFGLSLLVSRDIKAAVLTGLINLPATFFVVTILRQQRQRKLPFNALPRQLSQLEARKKQLIQSISTTATEQHRIEANLNFLKAELSQMYAQTQEQRSQKQQLNQELIALKERKSQVETEFQDLQTQISNIKQRREELYESVRSKRAERLKLETVNSLPVQLEQLQGEITEHQKQKQEIELNLAALKKMHPELEEKKQNLQAQIQELEKSKLELTQSLLAIANDLAISETSCNSLQLELIQLQERVIEQQKIKEDLEIEIGHLNRQREYTDDEEEVEITEEWHEFMKRLPKYELQVLKALIEPGNPNTKIKKIAEENITMPELLIDLLNERAFSIIGDLIIEPGKGALPPEISEEYLTKVKQVVKIKEVN